MSRFRCVADTNVYFIVTGDDDLLVLDPFRSIRILTPRNFMVIL
jgi:predicted nucleic acid-binding protein